MASTSTYLNFPRNTEEVFNFYKSVFGGEFSGGGIARFGDFPAPEGAPAIAEEDKKLIMHIELPILGRHILMGSDAPESLGYKINPGDNVRILLDPDTREETKRLFTALSEGGKITMRNCMTLSGEPITGTPWINMVYNGCSTSPLNNPEV